MRSQILSVGLVLLLAGCVAHKDEEAKPGEVASKASPADGVDVVERKRASGEQVEEEHDSAAQSRKTNRYGVRGPVGSKDEAGGPVATTTPGDPLTQQDRPSTPGALPAKPSAGHAGRGIRRSPVSSPAPEPLEAKKKGKRLSSKRDRGQLGSAEGGDYDKRGLRAELPRRPTQIVKGKGRAGMQFRDYGVNPTVDTAAAPRSTFSVDVDTASYTMARAFLERDQLPTGAAIRVEEIVNAFDYGYEAPLGETFSVFAEAAPSPSRPGYHLLHVGLKGKELQKSERKPANLVFVIDVSGSMAQDNRLGLVKRSLRLLVGQLDEADRVGIVSYGSVARRVLRPTSAHRKEAIMGAIEGLRTEGATNAEAGLRLGYQMAGRHLSGSSVSRVVLCSDGVANVGRTKSAGILAAVARERQRGITLSTIGVGMGTYNDVLMEQLADKGDGSYHYVDKLQEARRVFVQQLTATLEVIAKDVKIQLEFDPKAVARYRLIGYENRHLSSRQFNDDRVDAGEVGAGHSVTALYEIRLRRGHEGPLGQLKIRYKQPAGGRSTLLERALPRSIVRGSIDVLSSPTQLSLVAAQFAEKLRGSYWARNITYPQILARFEQLGPALGQRPRVRELRRLIERARRLDRRTDKFVAQHGPVAQMDFDRVPVLR